MNKWNEIFSDAEFLKKIIVLTPEEAQRELAAKGYEFSLEEITQAGIEISERLKKSVSGELSETELDEVTGGEIGWNYITGFALGIIGAAGIIFCGW